MSKDQSEDPNDPGVLQILGIKSTPHFKLFISMSVSFDYKRTFEAPELIKWIKGKILLTSSEIKDIIDFQIYHEEKRPLVGKYISVKLINIAYIGELQGQNCKLQRLTLLDIAYQETAKLLMYDKKLTFIHADIQNLNPDLRKTMNVPKNLNKYVIKVYNPNGNDLDFSDEEIDHFKLKDFIVTAGYSNAGSNQLACKFILS